MPVNSWVVGNAEVIVEPRPPEVIDHLHDQEVARDSPTGIASHLWRRVKPQMPPVLTFRQFV